MENMFEGTIATGKNALCMSGEIPKESIEGFRDFANSKEFVDPQCQPSANVDPMEVEGPSSLRAVPAVNKGKGLASDVHLFRGICKKLRKKRSVMQKMFNSLKNILAVIVESKSVSTHTSFASTAATEVQAILDMVLSLLRVQSGDCLHLFSTCIFMGNPEGRIMFAVLVHQKEVQLNWLAMQYQMNPQYHFSRRKMDCFGGLLRLGVVVIIFSLCTCCTFFFF